MYERSKAFNTLKASVLVCFQHDRKTMVLTLEMAHSFDKSHQHEDDHQPELKNTVLPDQELPKQHTTLKVK